MQQLEAKMMMRAAEREFLNRKLERTRMVHEAGLRATDPIQILRHTVHCVGSSLIARINRTRIPRPTRRLGVPASPHCQGEWQSSLS